MPASSDERPANIELREAVPEDAIDIVDVQSATWIDNYPNQRYDITEEDIKEIDWQSKIPAWQHMIKSPDYAVWVAHSAKKLKGFAAVVYGRDKVILDALYVLPKHQGSGIGSRLVNKVMELSGERTIDLQVAVYNDSAIAFYRQHGFEFSDKQGGAYYLPGGKTIPTRQMHYVFNKKRKSTGDSDDFVTRSQLADISNVRESTIKWYSEIGLLPFRQEAPGLRRRYRLQPALDRLREIAERQLKGQSIDDIKRDLTG